MDLLSTDLPGSHLCGRTARTHILAAEPTEPKETLTLGMWAQRKPAVARRGARDEDMLQIRTHCL